jgi:hypothetical protein
MVGGGGGLGNEGEHLLVRLVVGAIRYPMERVLVDDHLHTQNN